MKAVNDNFLDWGYVPGSPAETWVLQGQEEGRIEGFKLFALIVKLNRKGLSHPQIADKLSISVDRVAKILDDLLSEKDN